MKNEESAENHLNYLVREGSGTVSVLEKGGLKNELPVFGLSNYDLDRIGLSKGQIYEEKKLRERIEAARNEPQMMIYSEMLENLSGYLGSLPNSDTIFSRLKEKYEKKLPFGELNIKILHSLAFYIVRKRCEKPYLTMLKGNENISIRDGYKLNQMGLIVPSDAGLGWKLVEELSPRNLEKILQEYSKETNIPMQDVLRELRKAYAKPNIEDTAIEERTTSDRRKVISEHLGYTLPVGEEMEMNEDEKVNGVAGI